MALVAVHSDVVVPLFLLIARLLCLHYNHYVSLSARGQFVKLTHMVYTRIVLSKIVENQCKQTLASLP